MIAQIEEAQPPRDYAVAQCVRAWHELGTERQLGFAVGPIPVSKVWAWCDRHGLDGEAEDVLVHVIRTLDNERARAAAAQAAIKTAGGDEHQPKTRRR